MQNVLSNPKPGATSNLAHLPYIDCLRALACIAVIAVHTMSMTLPPIHSGVVYNALLSIAGRGWLGVHLFLVLSGFCLYHGVLKRATVAGASIDLKRFGARRCRRILPPYYLALLISALAGIAASIRNHLGVLASFNGVADIPSHLLMIHNFSSRTMYSINSPFWSLALESQLYLVFPLFVWIASKRGLAALGVLAFTISALYQFGVSHIVGRQPEWHLFGAAYYALPGRCFEFAVGMIAAALVLRPVKYQGKIAAVVVALLAWPAWAAAADQIRYTPFRDQIWGLIFASAAILCAKIPKEIFASRAGRVLPWIGAVSYSTYLYHDPLINIFNPGRFGLAIINDASFVLFGMIRAALLIAFGGVMYHLWEERFIDSKRAASRRMPDNLQENLLS